MRLAVLGATGMAGGAVVSEALDRGHGVVALSRNPARDTRDRLDSRAIDVADGAALIRIFTEVDAAVLAIRLPPGQEPRLAPLTRGALDAAQRHRRRILIVGGAAPLRSPEHAGRLVIDDPARVPAAWRDVAQASLDQFLACATHPHDGWVYLSPPAVLEPGERRGRYRRGKTTLLTDPHGRSRITASDLAAAVLDELENPGPDRHFTVAEDHSDRSSATRSRSGRRAR